MTGKRTYGEGCPIAHSLDLIGERWAMLVIRELRLGGRGYAEIAAALPGISPSVLSQRLRDLEAVGVLLRRGRQYRLTMWGAELEPVFRALAQWGARSPVVPLDGPVSADSLMLGLRTFFRPGDSEWTCSFEFHVGVETYRLDIVDGELTALWRGGTDGGAAVVVKTDVEGLRVLFGVRADVEELIRDGAIHVVGGTSELQRLVDVCAENKPGPTGPGLEKIRLG